MPERPPPHGERALVDEGWRDLALLLLVVFATMTIGAVVSAVVRVCS